jgi:hypothetical protein
MGRIYAHGVEANHNGEAPDAESRMISVQCEGDCGEYNMSFNQLSDYPKFKEGQI